MNKTRTIKTSFSGSNGNRLSARLEIPDTTARATIVFSHCFTCTKDILTAYRSSRLLAQNGYAVLRYDFAGLGDSEGNFADCNFSTTVEDCLAAIDFLRQNHSAPSVLIGHSLGGTTSLAAAISAPSIESVVTIASPSQPAHILHHFKHALTLLEQGIPASFEVAGKFYEVNPQFVSDVRQWDMQQKLASLYKPVLLFNVKGDALVSEKNAEEIHQWCAGDSRIVQLEHSDHLISDKTSHEVMINSIIDWLE